MVLAVGDKVCITAGPEKGLLGEVLVLGPGIIRVNLTLAGKRWFCQENCKLVVPYDSDQDISEPDLVKLGFVVGVLGRKGDDCRIRPNTLSPLSEVNHA